MWLKNNNVNKKMWIKDIFWLFWLIDKMWHMYVKAYKNMWPENVTQFLKKYCHMDEIYPVLTGKNNNIVTLQGSPDIS